MTRVLLIAAAVIVGAAIAAAVIVGAAIAAAVIVGAAYLLLLTFASLIGATHL